MMIQPRHNILAEKAIDLLKNELSLTNLYISGELKIETGTTWDKEIIFENCTIEHFSGNTTVFEKNVKLINCHFKKCQFVFTYFLGGLIIDNCIFDNYLDFQAGGHNKAGNEVAITNNNFDDFVNFFDCWYESNVIISNNVFRKGTNLLGKPYNIPVTFDIEPIVKNNIGLLGFDNEGEYV